MKLFLLYHEFSTKYNKQVLRHSENKGERMKVYCIWPETKWSIHDQAERKREGWTRVCCKILGWIVDRGERLIKFRDSWFSAKSI
jgi:hypothetical protein